MKSLILLIVTRLLILNEEAYLTKEIHLQNEFNHNLFSICLHTGIPNRINTRYLPHHPTQKQNKIILTLTKVQYLPIPSITNIPSINIIIPNTYINVPRWGFWGFRQTRQVITPTTIQNTIAHILYSSIALLLHTLKANSKRPKKANKSDH